MIPRRPMRPASTITLLDYCRPLAGESRHWLLVMGWVSQ